MVLCMLSRGIGPLAPTIEAMQQAFRHGWGFEAILGKKLVDAKNEEIEALNQGDPYGTQYEPLGYIARDSGRSLQAASTIHCYRKQAKQQGAMHTEAFLANLSVNPDGDIHGRRITWLELYILYRLRGGIKPIPDDVRKAISRATADKQIAAFKRKIKALTDRVLSDDGDLKLFKPFKAKPNELKGCRK